MATKYDFSIPLFLGYDRANKNKEVWVDIVAEIEKLMIIDKDGNTVQLILNPPQRKLLRAIAEDWNAGRRIRYIVLKARQMGFSTLIEAFIFVVTTYQRNQKSLIVADIADNASSLFEMSKRYYDTKEAGIFPELKKNNGKIIEYGGTNSSIRVVCQGDNAGRGKTAFWIHASEYAFWDYPEETMTAILQTVPTSNPRTGIFIESTANGFNSFKERWDKAVAGKSPFKPMFFAWWEMPDYREPYTGFELTPKEETLKSKYNLTNEQLTWRRYKLEELNGDENKFNQEYPSCPEDAFISTGYSVFNNEEVTKRKVYARENPPERRGFFKYDVSYSRDGKHITVSNIRWCEDKTGAIAIYREPLDGIPYVLGGDPANGGADSYAGCVINNITKQQCAVYNKPREDRDIYAMQMYCLGKMYNDALIGTETNISDNVMKLLYKSDYPKLYIRETDSSITENYLDAYGVKTTFANKSIMIDRFKTVFRENPEVILDYETACQMEVYIVEDKYHDRAITNAIKGKHDDNVMAYAIALHISDQQTTEIEVRSSKSESVFDWVYRTLHRGSEKGIRFNGYKS